MKSRTNIGLVLLFMILPALFSGRTYGQGSKKNSLRLKVDYVKVVDQNAFLDIKAIARIDKQMVDVPNIDLEVYYEYGNEEFPLGTTTTNMNGKSRFVLPSLDQVKNDSTATYTLGVAFNGNDGFKRASKTTSFKDATIKTKLITRDSINYIEATLIDVNTGLPIAENSLIVQVQRLLRPLRIGEEFNYTDENGMVVVPVEQGIPGMEGNLTLEVALSESEEYATVKSVIDAPYGVPIIEDSTYDERTLWAPRNKTPFFILFFTIFLVVITWGPIIYLIRNLIKINKS